MKLFFNYLLIALLLAFTFNSVSAATINMSSREEFDNDNHYNVSRSDFMDWIRSLDDWQLDYVLNNCHPTSQLPQNIRERIFERISSEEEAGLEADEEAGIGLGRRYYGGGAYWSPYRRYYSPYYNNYYSSYYSTPYYGYSSYYYPRRYVRPYARPFYGRRRW